MNININPNSELHQSIVNVPDMVHMTETSISAGNSGWTISLNADGSALQRWIRLKYLSMGSAQELSGGMLCRRK